MIRRLRLALPALLIATAAGCGGSNTNPVSGTVLVKGKAAAGVRVTFHPRGGGGTTPTGETDKDGRFTLSTAAPRDGAPPGEYAVTFELMRVSADTYGREIEVDAWKGKYADPAASTTMTVTVQKGENNLDPFRLD